MAKLVIVESPAKAKTIKKFLGSGYDVVASMGHVRDLPENRLSVDIKNDFAPRYAIIKGKEELVDGLKKAAGKSDGVLLAADPDREGEAISWHLAYILGLDMDEPIRVTFNEITESGLRKGIENPRTIDKCLVNSQQCRRILDRIVGYRLSPFVSQKIRRGLSAGRVQSVALRMICDREEEIRSFVPEEYWSIDAKLLPAGAKKPFSAEFYGTKDEKIELKSKEQTDAILSEIEKEKLVVGAVKKGQRKKLPAPPFITSTLQQEASRKLNFRSSKTMKLAQELYEGVEIEGMGAIGLITYMRTDSLRISDEARAAGEDYIKKTWGEKYLPDKPHKFKQRANAQDAHEAIRPTMAELTPESVKSSLSADQYKLYKMVWERFTASLMACCVHSTASAEILAGKYIFKASGYTVQFDGYTVLYESPLEEKDENEGALPKLEADMPLKVKAIEPFQHFTQPPARYTEGTLTRALEENGVGRPSTYQAIVTTVVNREYVVREGGKALKPTELGEQINKLMKERFSRYVNIKFTAQMEKNLDAIEHGDKDWIDTLHNFYDGFEKNLADAKKAMEGITMKLPDEETDYICEKCGRRMVIKVGRFGKFIACPGYPECRNIKKIVHETGVPCPLCGKPVIVKKSKRGRTFYGCSGYPECNFMSWTEPTAQKCPNCGEILYIRGGKRPKLYCAAQGCGYSIDKEDDGGNEE